MTQEATFGQKIGCLIIPAIFGIILFSTGFYSLYLVQPKASATTKIKNTAKTAIVISANDQQTKVKDGDLVAITGDLITNQKITVDENIIPANYTALKRNTEIFSWVEVKEYDSSVRNRRASTRNDDYKYVYKYYKKWEKTPEDTSKFRHPENYENKQKTLKDKEVTASSGKIGKYSLSISNLDLNTVFAAFALQKSTVEASQLNKVFDNRYIFYGKDWKNPSIGDERISYYYIPSKINGTLFGKVSGSEIKPYIVDKENNVNLYAFRKGGFDKAINSLELEQLGSSIFSRIVGFAQIFIAMFLIFFPLINVFKLGNIGCLGLIIVIFGGSIFVTGISLLLGDFLFGNIFLLIAYVIILLAIFIAINVTSFILTLNR